MGNSVSLLLIVSAVADQPKVHMVPDYGLAFSEESNVLLYSQKQNVVFDIETASPKTILKEKQVFDCVKGPSVEDTDNYWTYYLRSFADELMKFARLDLKINMDGKIKEMPEPKMSTTSSKLKRPNRTRRELLTFLVLGITALLSITSIGLSTAALTRQDVNSETLVEMRNGVKVNEQNIGTIAELLKTEPDAIIQPYTVAPETSSFLKEICDEHDITHPLMSLSRDWIKLTTR